MTVNSDHDVHVFHRDMTDHPADYNWPWLVEYADGTIDGYDTEDLACAFQREWRSAIGRDPMTGEKVGG